MPGSGSVQLTGTLGAVLKESVEVALSWVKGHAYDLGLTNDPSEDIMKKRSIHVHCPQGAVPKVRLYSTVTAPILIHEIRTALLLEWHTRLHSSLCSREGLYRPPWQ